MQTSTLTRVELIKVLMRLEPTSVELAGGKNVYEPSIFLHKSLIGICMDFFSKILKSVNFHFFFKKLKN